MIYKILPRKHLSSFRLLCEYITSEKENPDGRQLVVRHNLRGDTLDEIEAEYLANEAWRPLDRRNRTFAYHSILSFSDQDEISNEAITSTLKAYFKKRGEVIALAGVHRSTGTVHIHIAESGSTYRSGKSSRMSFNELKALKLHLEAHVREHHSEIEHSFCDHGNPKSKSPSDREYYPKLRGQSLRAWIKEQVEDCLKQSVSLTDFIQTLQDKELYTYERNQTGLTGVVFKERKFRFSKLGLLDQVRALDTKELEDKEATLISRLKELREGSPENPRDHERE